MKRIAMSDLLKWQKSRHRKPLLMTGVRQCGKTYLLKQFGAAHFQDTAYLNLEQNPRIASIFEEDLNPRRIVNDLSNVVLRRGIVPGQTLLVLDEIQAVPKAITALKYFSEELPELHLIGAGSLLGVSLRKGEASFPVGKVDRMELRPMGFPEFLWACGQELLQKGLEARSFQEELPAHYMEPLTRMLLNYYLVGGMPEAVAAWVETQDFDAVRSVQRDILSGYAADFAKHAPAREFEKLEAIWQAIPAQLAQENGKFVFSRVKQSARAKDLESSIQWLVDAGLIHLLKKVEHAEIPLSAHADNGYYKVYACDVGLLCCQAGLPYTAVLDDAVAFSAFKGALTENYALTELLGVGYTPYYWRSGNRAELDFLLEDKGRIIPIEAKAKLNTQAKSYREFARIYRPPLGFKLSLKNIGLNDVEQTQTYSLPLFMAYLLPEVVKRARGEGV